MLSSDPVDEAQLFGAHPIFRATDRDTLSATLMEGYGATMRGVGDTGVPLLAAANWLQVGGVHLHYCRYDAPVQIGFQAMPGYRQLICLSGQGEIVSSRRRMEIDEDLSGILPPETPFEASYSQGYQHIVLQFDEESLRRKAETLAGRPLPRDLPLSIMHPLAEAGRSRTRHIARALGQIFASEGAHLDTWAIEMSQALTSAFLIENMTGAREMLQTSATESGRTSVSRLEDYIQANWRRPIGAEEIAEACGVSVRSVFARFKRHRGVSPLTYLREVRLGHANRMLLQAEAGASVIDIALACGFASLGHFAQRYRERFGELPSVTLARGHQHRRI